MSQPQKFVLDATCWSVWAKSGWDGGSLVSWLPLYQHLDDTGGVAGLLMDHWVSPQAIAGMASAFPDGSRGMRALATWLAGTHDVGKVSPAFAVQVHPLTKFMEECGLAVPKVLAKDPDRGVVSHSLVGQVAVQDWLRTQGGFERRTAAAVASVIGSHHGVPPDGDLLHLPGGRPDLSGAGPWRRVRAALLDRATERLGGPDAVRAYSNVTIPLPTQVLLTAIVILADWIASNPDYFPLLPLSTLHDPPIPDEAVTQRRLTAGWELLGLPPRWSAEPLAPDLSSAMRTRFGRSSSRPVQDAAVRVAAEQPDPGLIVIEAPMGEGKTEAALLAVEKLAHRTGADGVFIALPSQATSDAMFERVVRWLDGLPGRADGAPLSVRLAHGKAHLNETFAGLVRQGRSGSVRAGDHDGVLAHRWLSGRKKGVLASFVVGTIDQVLFAALRSRHLMLRHLALAGKVVVIDEVHAYDVYMSQYLQRVLHWLGAYRVPVILLSATLPAARRAALLAAYQSGRQDGQVPVSSGEDSGYPLVSGTGVRALRVPASRPPVSIVLDRLPDELDSLVDYLRDHLVDGGCVAVIRNTVKRVQETAQRLADEFGAANVTVDHSRFLSCDRARIDRTLVRRFGPSSADRPPLHLVVGSQVLEQSLDVDFDLMVTDLAPMDLILQRIGRLHRHPRGRPGGLNAARCALVGVESWSQEPVTAVAGSQRVYGALPLLRAAALLTERDTVNLPGDIAPLVELAYGTDQVGGPAWQAALASAAADARRAERARVAAARDFLLAEVGEPGRDLVGWVSAGVGELDDDHRGRAQVRDGEESLEVLVVQRDSQGGLLTPTWLARDGGRQVPLDLEMPRWLALVIATCSLRLPLALSHPGVVYETITALEANKFTSFEQSPFLEGQLVLVLDENCQTRLRLSSGEFHLTYDPVWGLIHERR